MKSKPLTISIAVIILAIAAFLVFSSNNKDSNGSDPSTDTGQTGSGSSNTNRSGNSRSTHRTSSPQSNLEWEEKIDYVLGSESTSSEQAIRTLLGIVLDSKAPIAIRNDALEHALNLVEDENFGDIQSVMGSGKNELPEPLVQTILDDTMNRSDTIQLTTALKVIGGQHTAIIEEAIEMLEFNLEVEHGDNIQLWTKAVDAYIAQQKQAELKK